MSQVCVRNRKNADGSNSWQYYFELASVNGKRQRKVKGGFKTKKEALEAGILAMHRYNNAGQTFEPSEISVADFFDLYIEKYCNSELAPQTVEGYKKKIRLYIKPVIGEYKLRSITPMVLSDLLQSLKAQGYSRNTLVSIKALLSGAFAYAVSPLQFLSASPMVYVKLPKESEMQKKQTSSVSVRADGKKNGARRGAKPRAYIEKEWIQKIFQQFPEGHPDHIPLLLGYKLGLRIGEAYALTIDDFDFSAKTVSVNKQVQWNQSAECWSFKSPKYDSNRVISVDDELIACIKRKILQMKKDEKTYGEYYTRYYVDDYGNMNTTGSGKRIVLLNVRENGTFINPRTMQHCSHVIHHIMGYPEFDFHSLRHTHATDLAAAGALPKFVQTRLGHKSIKVTMEIYQHLTDEMEQQGTDILNKIYGTA